MSFLHKEIVLVLNRNWQAIGVKTPAETFGMLMTDNATALYIEGTDNMTPMRCQSGIIYPLRIAIYMCRQSKVG